MGEVTWGGEEGTLPAATAALYTVPASTVAVVRLITAQNSTGGDETIRFYKRAAAVDYEIVNQTLADGHLFNGPNSGAFQLDAGDSIRGDDNGAAAGIDYTISYAEEAL